MSQTASATAGPTRTLLAAERAENFPVALRLLPVDLRQDLRAVYGVARTIDDAGDDPNRSVAERFAALDQLADDLAAAFDGRSPQHAAVRALVPTVARRRLDIKPFLDLVQANRLDQAVARYQTYGDLRGYCRLSADPVGRIVLQVFGIDDDVARRRSDAVCTALQILEHCQDVAEDKRLRDRVYLPLDDLASCGVDLDSLGSTAPPTDAMRAVVAFEAARALGLLREGRPLVTSLHGWARVAVAGFVAGGLATADALRRSSYDVWTVVPRPRRRDVIRHAAALVRGRAS